MKRNIFIPASKMCNDPQASSYAGSSRVNAGVIFQICFCGHNGMKTILSCVDTKCNTPSCPPSTHVPRPPSVLTHVRTYAARMYATVPNDGTAPERLTGSSGMVAGMFWYQYELTGDATWEVQRAV